jgi:hypothetical protein
MFASDVFAIFVNDCSFRTSRGTGGDGGVQKVQSERRGMAGTLRASPYFWSLDRCFGIGAMTKRRSRVPPTPAAASVKPRCVFAGLLLWGWA